MKRIAPHESVFMTDIVDFVRPPTLLGPLQL